MSEVMPLQSVPLSLFQHGGVSHATAGNHSPNIAWPASIVQVNTSGNRETTKLSRHSYTDVQSFRSSGTFQMASPKCLLGTCTEKTQRGHVTMATASPSPKLSRSHAWTTIKWCMFPDHFLPLSTHGVCWGRFVTVRWKPRISKRSW